MCMNLPFGDDLICSANDLSEHHFTGQIYDPESKNDYFNARYYSNNTGRFLSPDYNDRGSIPDPVPYADYTNPQSLNLYSYVKNNPLSRTDPDGHGCFDSDASSSTDANGNLQVNGGCDWGDFIPTLVEVSQFVDQVKKTAQQAVNQISNIMNTPGGPGCMAGLAAGGAGAGAAAGGGVGLVGLAGGGVGVVVTEPAGLVAGGVGGAGSGIALGMSICPGGAAFSKGRGGSSSRPKFDKNNPAHRNMTADSIISNFKQGGIRSVFPSEKLPLSYSVIEAEAKSGDDAAQTAVKLLTNSRFDK